MRLFEYRIEWTGRFEDISKRKIQQVTVYEEDTHLIWYYFETHRRVKDIEDLIHDKFGEDGYDLDEYELKMNKNENKHQI